MYRQPDTKINVGDVGYIRDGRFEVLFPALSASEIRGKKIEVPSGFEGAIAKRTEKIRDDAGCLHTTNVKYTGPFKDGQTFTPLYVLFIALWPILFKNVPPRLDNESFTFTLPESQEKESAACAAVVARCSTKRVDLPMDTWDLLKEYFRNNLDVWSQIEEKSPQEVHPVIVYGFDLAEDLAMMSYPSTGVLEPPEPTDYSMFSNDSEFRGRWSSKSRPYCEEHPSRHPDQCVFVRYITTRKNLEVLTMKGGAGSDSGDSESGDDDYDKWDVIADHVFKVFAIFVPLEQINEPLSGSQKRSLC